MVTRAQPITPASNIRGTVILITNHKLRGKVFPTQAPASSHVPERAGNEGAAFQSSG